VKLEQARPFCLSLPETSDEPHFDMTSFRVRRRIFVTVPPDDTHLHVFVDEGETRAVVTENPAAFEELWWGKQLRGVRVNLAAADADRVCELLEEAWRRKALRRLVVAHDTVSPPRGERP
jgi:hypothetical protein